ncbi:MAG: hypothetical protein V3V08_04560 [Nannocystaceae bacterium]
MGVPRIYSTGKDNVEVVETLASKICLRNTQRDQATGDDHVAEEDAARGMVEGVRVFEMPP